MAEIKTCEQYVLNILNDREKEIVELKEQIEKIQSHNRELQKEIDEMDFEISEVKMAFEHYATLGKCENEPSSNLDGMRYINFGGVWEDEPAFTTIINFLNFLKEEE